MINEAHDDKTGENPAGTRGFAFMEYAVKDPEPMRELFTQMGFFQVAGHRSKSIEIWQQGNIYYLINSDPRDFSADFFKIHGPSVSGMAFRVEDSKKAFEYCISKGATPYPNKEHWTRHPHILRGIGDNLLYLIDDAALENFFRKNFEVNQQATDQAKASPLLVYIDHVTHNVYKGNMDRWAQFYQDLFNFRQIRYFDIQGKYTGLYSRAMTSPCGKISIPINEPADEQSQIQEYLNLYHGEGIQHIALACSDIYQAVEAFKNKGMKFLDTPEAYYRLVDQRLPGHGESLERMREDRILIDGSTAGGVVKTLLQIFTDTTIGPVFFELIQRKGDKGFGEGNFQALFDSMELDQIERGVIKTKQ